MRRLRRFLIEVDEVKCCKERPNITWVEVVKKNMRNEKGYKEYDLK